MNKRKEDGRRTPKQPNESGFSLIELIMSMVLTLAILAIAVATFSGALGTRERETSRTDAINSAQAALNIMSREIGNAGYGLMTNGIVISDCNDKRLHFRTNVANSGASSSQTDLTGEDVTYFYDESSQSVVRYDRIGGTSGIINRVSDVDFIYYDYSYNPITNTTTVTPSAVCSAATAKVNIRLKVLLADVQGQPSNRIETISSDVTLRNSPYMLGQY